MAESAGDDAHPVGPPLPWRGWRRKKGDHGPDGYWKAFPPADALTRGECYQKLMDLSELAAHEGQWEYLILPTGERPPALAYRTRELRPGQW